MPTIKDSTLEPHARHIGSVMLIENADFSWSIGTALNNAVKVQFGDISAIDDSTFGYSAMAAESNGQGGYRLFVRSDEDEDLIVEVRVDAAGKVDPASVRALSAAEMYAVEEQYKIDLNESGGFGAGPVLLQGGAVNLYMNELGFYQVGDGAGAPKTLTLGGTPLDDQLLPPGWEIVEAIPRADGYDIFAQDPSGTVYDARFDSNGGYTGGDFLQGAALDGLEQGAGIDIDGDNDLPAPAGWTSTIKSDFIRSAVDKALGPATGALSAGQAVALASPLETNPANTVTHAELVGMLRGLIQTKKDSNAPITAQEVADLQALAARGKAAFAGNGASAEYLSYVFGKLVEGSDANRFFNGGNTQRGELGSLGAGSSAAVLEKLVDKWLLGGDMPSPATAGDSATGTPKAVTATYEKSTGALFVDGISVTDVNQGTAGDCYLIAAMGGIAVTKPDALQSMFVENAAIDGTRTWGVRFFDAGGKAQWVTVNDMLPVPVAGSGVVAFAGPANKDLNGEIWVPLMEKAYAQANSLGFLPRDEKTGQNSFAAIEGGFGDPLGAVIGAKVYAFIDEGSGFGKNDYLVTNGYNRSDAASKAQVESVLKAAINANKTVWVGVAAAGAQKDAFGNQALVGGHAHFLIDANPADPNNGEVLAYNPWGQSPASNPPGPLTTNFLSPAPYTLAELVGLTGVYFMLLEGPAG
jgi:Calpain family cysteine protease